MQYIHWVNFAILLILLIISVSQICRQNKDKFTLFSRRLPGPTPLEEEPTPDFGSYDSADPMTYIIPNPPSQAGPPMPYMMPQGPPPYGMPPPPPQNPMTPYPYNPGPQQMESTQVMQGMPTPYQDAFDQRGKRMMTPVQKSFNRFPEGMNFSPSDAFNRFESIM